MNLMNLRNIRLGSRPLTIGLIFGVILAFVLVLYSLIAPFVDQTLGTISFIINIAIYVVFGFLAGRRASKLDGKLASGIAAGALAGLVSSLLSGIYALILTLVNINYFVQQAKILANKQHPAIPITPMYIMQAELAYLVTPLLFAFLLVLIGGTMGGFLGKGRARLAPVEETPEAEEVITTTEVAVQEDGETPTPSYSSNGARRSAASRRSRNARRNRSAN